MEDYGYGTDTAIPLSRERKEYGTGTVPYGTVRYRTVRYGSTEYGTVRYRTGTVTYCTVVAKCECCRYGTVPVPLGPFHTAVNRKLP